MCRSGGSPTIFSIFLSDCYVAGTWVHGVTKITEPLCAHNLGGGGAEKVGRSVSMEREVTQTITHCADSKYDEQDTLRGNFHSHHRILGH